MLCNPYIFDVLSSAVYNFGNSVLTGIDGFVELIRRTYTEAEAELSDVIDDILTRARNNKPDSSQQKHHIAPRNIYFSINGKLVYCSEYLDKSYISINDPVNLVMLDSAFHRALNTNIYYSLIHKSTESAYEKGGYYGVYSILLFYKILLSGLNTLY